MGGGNMKNLIAQSGVMNTDPDLSNAESELISIRIIGEVIIERI